jgi:hypothetical protein
MELLMTAVYTSSYKRVTINFMMNDDHEFSACGDVTDEEIEMLAAAGGGNVAGWDCEIRI